MQGRRSSWLSLAVLSGLFFAAFVLAIGLNSGPGNSSQVAESVTAHATFGTLLVETLVGTSPSSCSNSSTNASASATRTTTSTAASSAKTAATSAVSNVTVSISNATSPATGVQTIRTNSSGAASLRLVVGKYEVRISDPRFETLEQVQIYDVSTTEVKVSACPVSYQVKYEDAFDPYSTGWVTSSQGIFVELSSNSTIAPLNDTVFIQLQNPSKGGYQVGAIVKEETIRSGACWLQLQPTDEIRTSDLPNMQVVTYTSSSQIRTYPS